MEESSGDLHTFQEYQSYFLQDSGREECKDGDDRDDAHVAHPLHDRELNAPQANGHKTDEGNPVLLEGKLFLGRSDRFDFKLRSVRSHARSVTCKEEEPDEDDGDCRHR